MNKILTMSLQVLQELEKMPVPWSSEATLVFGKFLTIAEQIFTWEFVPQNCILYSKIRSDKPKFYFFVE